MKFKQITVQDSIQLNEGHWRKVEWVAELEEGETPEQKTTEAKDRLVNWFAQNHPNNYFNTPSLHVSSQWEQEPTPTLSTEEMAIKEIEHITDPKNLEAYQLLSKNNAAIKAAYDLQMLKLKPKP